MNVLRAQINKIKRYNIYSLFNVKNILNKILDKLSNTIICKVEITGLMEYGKLFRDFDIPLTKSNFKNYFNLSIEDIWKNRYNIDTFKFQIYYYDKDADGWHYRTFNNSVNDVCLSAPLIEMGVDYYQLYLTIQGPEVFDHDDEGRWYKGHQVYTVYLNFTKNGELIENESKIDFSCDVIHQEDVE